MHPLQDLFATSEGERSFDDRLNVLFAAGDFAAAEALLAADLATMDGEIARMCRELSRDAVTLAGWEDLVEAIELLEGEPVTGVTLAIANDPDLAFEKGRLQEPFVTVGLHTDEAFRFSGATPAELLAEAGSANGAAWEGHEEDVELYLEISGLGPLNTALLDHIQRHFFRDDSTAPAPMSYVDYVIGCWWRALRFQQAVATECARYGLPGGIPVVASTVDMRPELASVHVPRAPAAPTARRAEPARMADLTLVLETAQIEKSSQLERAASVEEIAPPADLAPLIEEMPVAETVPAGEPTPVEETAPLAEASPVVDLPPLAELAPPADLPPPVELRPLIDMAPVVRSAPEPEPEPEPALELELEAALEPEEALVAEPSSTADAPEPEDAEEAEETVVAEEVREPAQMAEITPAAFIIPRKTIEEDDKPTGTGLRRRFAEAEREAAEVPARKWGFLSRLFGRAQSYDEAA